MIRIEFNEEFRVFEQGTIIEFPGPVTILVGDQGSGKSSLMTACFKSTKHPFKKKVSVTIDDGTPSKASYFDTEQSNPRVQGYFDDKISTIGQIALRFSSHGEAIRAIMTSKDVLEWDTQQVFFIDEPESGLSLTSQVKVRQHWEKMLEKGHHLMIATHAPVLMKAASQVYDLESRSFINTDAYLNNITEGLL